MPSVERLRLTQRYPEVSAIGLLDDQMNVARIARTGRTAETPALQRTDATSVLGPEAINVAMACRDRGRPAMTGQAGPFGVVVLMPMYRHLRHGGAVNE